MFSLKRLTMQNSFQKNTFYFLKNMFNRMENKPDSQINTFKFKRTQPRRHEMSLRDLSQISIERDHSKHSSWWRRLSSSSSEDVFKTSWLRPIYSSWPYVFKRSSRRLLQDVFKTSSRHFEDVFKTSLKRLQDLFKTFWRRLQDVFKTSSRRSAKISSRRFQDVPSS